MHIPHHGSPTADTYDALGRIYKFMNWKLFRNKLPECLITLQRKSRCYGYFSPSRFKRNDGITSDEIALNPAHFDTRPHKEIIATLVHEMVHLWQQHHGTPSRGSYHNREWADKMITVGLHPSSTGEQGGRETGDKMSHFIIEGGAFELAYRELEKSGLKLVWSEVKPEPNKSSRSGNRQKYSCPSCGTNIWGAEGIAAICETDNVKFEPQ